MTKTGDGVLPRSEIVIGMPPGAAIPRSGDGSDVLSPRQPSPNLSLVATGEKRPAKSPISLADAEKKARNCVNAWAAAAAASHFIPGSSMAVLVAGNVKLHKDIAQCFGVDEWSTESLSAAVAASISTKMIAREALSFIPILGGAIKAVGAGAIAKAAGDVVVTYFKSRSPYTDN